MPNVSASRPGKVVEEGLLLDGVTLSGRRHTPRGTRSSPSAVEPHSCKCLTRPFRDQAAVAAGQAMHRVALFTADQFGGRRPRGLVEQFS